MEFMLYGGYLQSFFTFSLGATMREDSSCIFEEPYPVDTDVNLDNISDLTSSLIIATRYINHQKQNKGAGPLIVKVNVLLI